MSTRYFTYSVYNYISLFNLELFRHHYKAKCFLRKIS